MQRVSSVSRLPLASSWFDQQAAQVLFESLVRAKLPRTLDIQLPDGSSTTFGPQPTQNPVRLAVHRWEVFRRVLWEQDIGAGETYGEGWWDTNDLVGLCRMLLRSQELWTAPSWARALFRLVHWVRWKSQRNSLRGSQTNIAYHYDLSNEFYRLFLDETLTYSCAWFHNEETSLAEAQRAKLDYACHQLQLQPGQRVLEIGCGWGSFALHAATHYGVEVHGISLSRKQLELAQERAAEAGLGDRCRFDYVDYRNVQGTYDHVVSIEMFEAVGHEYYRHFFKAVDRCLRPGGRFFLQTITIPDQRYDRYRREFDFIKKHIFPGGLLASLARILETTKQHTQLRLLAMRDIGTHYTRTLHEWRQRFLAALPQVRALGFDTRFARLWEFYLASCEAAFAERHIGDAQLLFERQS